MIFDQLPLPLVWCVCVSVYLCFCWATTIANTIIATDGGMTEGADTNVKQVPLKEPLDCHIVVVDIDIDIYIYV
jgi:hypothetical protein